ncbi:hypothetical protein P3X46_009975 [Hevea brasiliensis]|uniref:Methionine adenosyltransferase n=1 Tax=Hevea brasiliensis TaxID=3981 RepID=A0ABQ9MGN2_HEVBR|nr:hypothetical protein P3X46_009975 [Hevea brasiliensis]
MVMVFVEITTSSKVKYENIFGVDTCKGIAFVLVDVGLDADNCKGVHGHLKKNLISARDQDPELMPLTHLLATKVGAGLTEVRKNKTCPWLRHDGKTQVTVEYQKEGEAMVTIRVHTVLISIQHNETVTNEKIAEELKEHVIKPVIPPQYLDGRFVIGGPHGDAGLTGRKIIIQTYGGWGAHADHSGAYIVRQAAKSVVASGLAQRWIVLVSYANYLCLWTLTRQGRSQTEIYRL